MSILFDSLPYPFHEPEAQQFHERLSQLYPSVKSAVLIAERAGLSGGMIFQEQPVFYVWKDILEAAAGAGIVRHVAEQANQLLNNKSPFKSYFEELLAGKTPPVEAEPRAADGSPNFINSDDEITEPETLLYYDDLTLQIGRVGSLIKTLQRMAELAPSVCRLVIDIHGIGQYGTAFRIAPDMLLTNWHVLHKISDGTRATAVTAEFGYEDDGSGGALAPTVIPCDVESIVADKSDDWGIIRAKQPLDVKIPIIKLSDAVDPVLHSSAYIIQHPGGERKRIGFVRNQISFFDDRVVHYLTDTQAGSSGSPVFDAEGQLIALHHAGGRPQEVPGRIPMKKNEGIKISRIANGLAQQGISIF